MQIYDLIGIGFGPSNIALAITLEEKKQTGYHIDAFFIEKQPEFAWHANMMLDNAHMRGRGMIEQIDHPRLGRIAVPGSPMRSHGTPQMPSTPSASAGQDNVQVYGELLGLGAEAVAVLRREGVI